MLSSASTLIDVAYAVCTALSKAGATAILVGGSAATFYVPERYSSLDADFILHFDSANAQIAAALQSIGFRPYSPGSYAHAESMYTVDFPRGPIAIGRDHVTAWNTVHRANETLHVLTETDALRDRFLHYWAWDDASAYAVALDIAKSHASTIDWLLFRHWTGGEHEAEPSYDLTRVGAFLADAGAPRG